MMDDMASLWSYQENVDELKQKLLCTSIELEQLKMEASEELRKNKEYAKQLLQLLKMACQERDEARDELQKLMNKFMLSSEFFNGGIPQFHPDSHSPPPPPLSQPAPPPPHPPLLKPTKANSSITESNSHSETYNYHSHGGSSPGDSFFDAVSSSPTEFSNINMADSTNIAASFVNQPLIQNNVIQSGISKVVVVDQGSLVIDSLAKGKSLPQKGNFLKAVLDSGPLLQNLLVAGPLPRWRNPPQLHTFHIPPVSIKGCTSSSSSDAADIVHHQKTSANLNQFGSRFQNPSTTRPYAEMSCSTSQFMSTDSMLNFGNGSVPSGACISSDMLISANASSTYSSLGKRKERDFSDKLVI